MNDRGKVKEQLSQFLSGLVLGLLVAAVLFTKVLAPADDVLFAEVRRFVAEGKWEPTLISLELALSRLEKNKGAEPSVHAAMAKLIKLTSQKLPAEPTSTCRLLRLTEDFSAVVILDSATKKLLHEQLLIYAQQLAAQKDFAEIKSLLKLINKWRLWSDAPEALTISIVATLPAGDEDLDHLILPFRRRALKTEMLFRLARAAKGRALHELAGQAYRRGLALRNNKKEENPKVLDDLRFEACTHAVKTLPKLLPWAGSLMDHRKATVEAADDKTSELRWQFLQGLSASMRKDVDGTIELLAPIVDSYKSFEAERALARAYSKRGWGYLSFKHFDRAHELFDGDINIVLDYVLSSAFHYGPALSYRAQQKWREKVPLLVRFIKNLRVTHYSVEDDGEDQVIQYTEERLQKFPYDPVAALVRAETHFIWEQGSLELVQGEIPRIKRLYANNPHIDFLQARIAQRQGKNEEALQAYLKGIVNRPQFIQYEDKALQLAQALGRTKELLESCDEAIRAAPDELLPLERKSNILHSLGRLAETTTVDEEILARLPRLREEIQKDSRNHWNTHRRNSLHYCQAKVHYRKAVRELERKKIWRSIKLVQSFMNEAQLVWSSAARSFFLPFSLLLKDLAASLENISTLLEPFKSPATTKLRAKLGELAQRCRNRAK